METADRRVPTGGDSDPLAIDRRSRRAFTISLLVVLAVVVVALVYATVRDPGPQPTVPPKISGTENGGLKRAVVHYVGALEHQDVDELVDLMGDDVSPQQRAFAEETVEKYGPSAEGKASVVVRENPELPSNAEVTITFADGTKQTLTFANNGGGPWRPVSPTELS